MEFPILSWIVFLPLAGAFLVGVWSRREPSTLKGIALVFSSATFILGVVLYVLFCFFLFVVFIGFGQFYFALVNLYSKSKVAS